MRKLLTCALRWHKHRTANGVHIFYSHAVRHASESFRLHEVIVVTVSRHRRQLYVGDCLELLLEHLDDVFDAGALGGNSLSVLRGVVLRRRISRRLSHPQILRDVHGVEVRQQLLLCRFH